MTVLPVTTMSRPRTPSRRRLAFAPAVGARCRAASWEVSLRLPSSGNGFARSPVRRPASRWRTGTRHRRLRARGEAGRRVSLDENGVGSLRLDHVRDPLQNQAGHVPEPLTFGEDVEIVTRPDAEQRIDLIQHLRCCPVTATTAWQCADRSSSATIGAILMASGRVP